MAYSNLGYTYLLMERYEEATEALDKSLSIEPENISSLSFLGVASYV